MLIRITPFNDNDNLLDDDSVSLTPSCCADESYTFECSCAQETDQFFLQLPTLPPQYIHQGSVVISTSISVAHPGPLYIIPGTEDVDSAVHKKLMSVYGTVEWMVWMDGMLAPLHRLWAEVSLVAPAAIAGANSLWDEMTWCIKMSIWIVLSSYHMCSHDAGASMHS